MSTRNQKFAAFGAGVAIAGVASAITYFATRKLLETEYEERLAKEIKESIDFLVDQKIGSPTVSETLDAAELEIEEVEEFLEELEPVEGTRVFGSTEAKPSLDDLAKNQKVQYNSAIVEEDSDFVLPEPPYEDPDISIISRDIFIENGTEWEQETLTYFADGGVINVAGDFVDNHELMIGVTVPKFGELSEDANIVFIRNKKLEKEYEIISDPGNASDFLAHSLEDMYRPSQRR